MPDQDFPSGPWTGYYQYQNGVRGQQDLRLAFAQGRMSGTGADQVGQFIVEGSYSTDTKEEQWLKSYPGGHTIEYRGFREGPLEGIWGTWKISADWHGGFHIWPLEHGNAVLEEETEQDEIHEDPLIRKAVERFKERLLNAD